MEPSISLSTFKGFFDCFANFGDITTLHGLRYFTNRNHSAKRRLVNDNRCSSTNVIDSLLSIVVCRTVWLMLVMLSSWMFVYQCIDRINFYLSRPVTILLADQYRESVTFPAVTICNQNVFKLEIYIMLTVI